MTEKRKQDHIELAFKSVPKGEIGMDGMCYEPMLAGHPRLDNDESFEFAGGSQKLELWVSSMTGGTEKAKTINTNLAKACKEFGLGMGLGSCRPLLHDQRWEDFNLRELLAEDTPLYTNFGIAQVEELLKENQGSKLDEITKRLRATGIIVHINPLQEWAQPEGDRYYDSPLTTIKRLLEVSKYPLIVKEVGQGFGPKSLEQLVKLPLEAVELAGFGGTNFTILEQARLSASEEVRKEIISRLGEIGHTAEEMINWLNAMDFEFNCKSFIVSGGIKDPVSGYILNKKLNYKSVFGMASQFLKHSTDDYEKLKSYVEELRSTLKLCDHFIKGPQ